MLSEVRLIVGAKDARLILKKTDKETVEEEVWNFERRVSSAYAQEIARVIFDDAYEVMQYAIHGE